MASRCQHGRTLAQGCIECALPPRAIPLKTRYTIIEPGPLVETDEPIEVSRLATLEWVDVEFEREVPTYRELCSILGPIFNPRDFERVAVNSFKGPADMFVGERSACHPRAPVNQLATLVYWTASILHEIAPGGCDPLQYEGIRRKALEEAADRLTVAPAERWAPQIYGRAVLFDELVWR